MQVSSGGFLHLNTIDLDGNGDGIVGSINDPTEYARFTVPFTFGSPNYVTLFETTSANATNNGRASAAAAIGWGGIINVRDADGNSLLAAGAALASTSDASAAYGFADRSFTVTAESGLDYLTLAAPPEVALIVPEPASLAALAGAAIVALRRRR